MLGPETERPGVVVDVIPHEGGDEVVRMIVQGLHSNGHRVLGIAGSKSKVFRFQLLLQERIGSALKNNNSIYSLAPYK